MSNPNYISKSDPYKLREVVLTEKYYGIIPSRIKSVDIKAGKIQICCLEEETHELVTYIGSQYWFGIMYP